MAVYVAGIDRHAGDQPRVVEVELDEDYSGADGTQYTTPEEYASDLCANNDLVRVPEVERDLDGRILEQNGGTVLATRPRNGRSDAVSAFVVWIS